MQILEHSECCIAVLWREGRETGNTFDELAYLLGVAADLLSQEPVPIYLHSINISWITIDRIRLCPAWVYTTAVYVEQYCAD